MPVSPFSSYLAAPVRKSQLLSRPDLPRTADQRVYHLGIRAGEVANRIVSCQLGRWTGPLTTFEWAYLSRTDHRGIALAGKTHCRFS